MNHIYLSPHLDDAVLSCGGAIHRQATSGEPVQTITVFAGDAQDDPVPPFAREQHDYWGNPPQPMALRRSEDAAALALLGAGVQHLGYLDAVYRTGAGSQSLYADVEALLGEVHAADRLGQEGVDALVDLLDGTISTSGVFDRFPPEPCGNDREDMMVVYAPLGVGCHVDHQIVHRVGRQLLARGYRMAFYEDYPYAERPGALESTMLAAGADGWKPETITLDAANLTAKVSALGYYRTQMTVLFGGPEAMPNRVWAFAATRSPGAGLGERIWWPPASGLTPAVIHHV